VNEVEVSSAGIDDPPWLRRCESFAAKVLSARGINRWELSILMTDDRTITELNRRYRNVDGPTDILSFSQEPSNAPPAVSPAPAGDIVISLETMIRNARQGDIPEEEELKRLVIHGILHLQGMDHQEEGSGMIELQEKILRRLQKERIF
jgi:probable rRNA maturation factor